MYEAEKMNLRKGYLFERNQSATGTIILSQQFYLHQNMLPLETVQALYVQLHNSVQGFGESQD